MHDPLDDVPPNTDTPSASDPPDTAKLKIGKQPLAEVLRGAVLGAGEYLHHTLARTEPEIDQGVWLMRGEKEAASIADPTASIIGRHTGGQLVNVDLNDLINLGLSAAAYLLHNGLKAFRLRRAVKRMAAAGFFTPEPQPEGA